MLQESATLAALHGFRDDVKATTSSETQHADFLPVAD
jgi:hypothetical protein